MKATKTLLNAVYDCHWVTPCHPPCTKCISISVSYISVFLRWWYRLQLFLCFLCFHEFCVSSMKQCLGSQQFSLIFRHCCFCQPVTSLCNQLFSFFLFLCHVSLPLFRMLLLLVCDFTFLLLTFHVGGFLCRRFKVSTAGRICCTILINKLA